MTSDLISRREAIDALWNALYEYEDETEKQFRESEDLDVRDWIGHRIFVQNMNDIDRQTILNLPSIDAVQVVQCKDCLFNDGDGPNEDDKYWCALHQSFMQYCSEAERKKETCNNKTGNLQ